MLYDLKIISYFVMKNFLIKNEFVYDFRFLKLL